MAKNEPRDPVTAEISNKGGVFALTVNHGDATFKRPVPTKGKNAGKPGKELVAAVGSQFGSAHIGNGWYVSFYLAKGDAPVTGGGAFTVKD